jgi:hypothetical protein
LRWELDEFTDELSAAKASVVEMIKDSDLCVMTPSYSKGFPKKCKLSPDGWFQVGKIIRTSLCVVARKIFRL